MTTRQHDLLLELARYDGAVGEQGLARQFDISVDAARAEMRALKGAGFVRPITDTFWQATPFGRRAVGA